MNITGVADRISGIYPQKTGTTQTTDTRFSELLNSAEKGVRAETGLPHSAEAPNVNKYFRLADESGIINYRGVIFTVDREHNNLLLGDCRDSRNCLRIPLSGGGNLIVNRENLGDLKDAISMFSPEDIGRILRAIELDQLAQRYRLEEEEEEEEADDVLMDAASETASENSAVSPYASDPSDG